MPVIHLRDRNSYTRIDKSVWNSGLSIEAEAVLLYMLSKTASWSLIVKHIANRYKTTPKRVRKWINELEDKGFVLRTGNTCDTEYFVYEHPTLNQHYKII